MDKNNSKRSTPKLAALGLLTFIALIAGVAIFRSDAAKAVSTTTVLVGQKTDGTAADQYNPASVTITLGDTVSFTRFAGSHDATSAVVPAGASAFASPSPMVAGAPFAVTPTATGIYTFYCSIHSNPTEATLANVDANIAAGRMVGKIVVTAPAATATPTSTPATATATPTATATGTATPTATATATATPTATATGTATPTATATGTATPTATATGTATPTATATGTATPTATATGTATATPTATATGTATPTATATGTATPTATATATPTPTPLTLTSKEQCKKDGWKAFNNPAFKNQGACVSFIEAHRDDRDDDDDDNHHGHHDGQDKDNNDNNNGRRGSDD